METSGLYIQLVPTFLSVEPDLSYFTYSEITPGLILGTGCTTVANSAVLPVPLTGLYQRLRLREYNGVSKGPSTKFNIARKRKLQTPHPPKKETNR